MLKSEINKTLLTSEIDILKAMRDVPHVLTLHEVYTTKNNTYIITELCDTDLGSKIKRGLNEREALGYMGQILEGYSHIHARSIIHRDLKPANLLITKTNDLKIADFGFGVRAEEVAKSSKYNVGSPLYMAPESLRKNEYSFKTDIWALGIIFFEMLTGDTPWRAKNEKELLRRIEAERIEEILSKQKLSQISKEFLKLALCHDKAQRIGP
jgi:serine/threonine protein kinase